MATPIEALQLDESGDMKKRAPRNRTLTANPSEIAHLRARVDAVYLHIDMDFLDSKESPGVNFRGPGGVPVTVPGRRHCNT